MAQYTPEQKAFVFSMVSNAAANRELSVPELEALVVKRFADVVSTYPQYLGAPWSLAWGPVVYQAPDSKVADNTIFVAQGVDNGKALFIVAIAGTNAVSMFDGSTDFDVFVQVPFNGDAKTSRGTRNDVNILKSLTFRGQTLQQFLLSAASPQAGLIFTGHSLGGALAPTLALDYSVNTSDKLGAFGQLYVYPTAGPTPGNDAFARLYGVVFRPVDGVNANVVNSFDVVPLAWANLNRVTRLYLRHINSLCIDAVVHALITKLTAAKVQYSDLPLAPFAGAFNSNLVPAAYPNFPAVKFAVQALYQHINGYIAQLIPELESVFDIPELTAAQCTAIHDKCSLQVDEELSPGPEDDQAAAKIDPLDD